MVKQPTEQEALPFRAPPALFLGVLLLGVLLHIFFPVQLLSAGRSIATGVPLVVLSIGLWAWAVGVMVRAGTSPVPRRPTTSLVMEGPFRYSRNPIYLAYTLAYAGVGCLVGSAWVLALLPLALALVQRLSIASEERYLTQRFGEAYLSYKARVRRWI